MLSRQGRLREDGVQEGVAEPSERGLGAGRRERGEGARDAKQPFSASWQGFHGGAWIPSGGAARLRDFLWNRPWQSGRAPLDFALGALLHYHGFRKHPFQSASETQVAPVLRQLQRVPETAGSWGREAILEGSRLRTASGMVVGEDRLQSVHASGKRVDRRSGFAGVPVDFGLVSGDDPGNAGAERRPFGRSHGAWGKRA